MRRWTAILAAAALAAALAGAAPAMAACYWCMERVGGFRCETPPKWASGRTGCRVSDPYWPCDMWGDTCQGSGDGGGCETPLCGPFQNYGLDRGPSGSESSPAMEERCPYLGYCPARSAEWY